jgi:hypothetical protein
MRNPQQSQQPARFAQRTYILRDLNLSSGAARLFLLLDDESRGADAVRVNQLRLAVSLGVSTREIRYRMRELLEAGHLTVSRHQNGNMYEFARNACSASDRNSCSAPIGTPVPLPPNSVFKIRQEAFTSNEDETQTPECGFCDDTGWTQTPAGKRCCTCLLGAEIEARLMAPKKRRPS